MIHTKKHAHYSPYTIFTKEEWRRLRDATPLPLSEAELGELQGVNERISLDEVEEVYLPLSRLLNLYVAKAQELHDVTSAFHGHGEERVPYIIGIAGSVAVGKSTTARIIQALLARWPNHPKVDLITTDGFLYPNAVLEARNLMNRKGFPESYNRRKLLRFLADVKSGKPEIAAPVYSHLVYDIVADEAQLMRQPDIIIVEGLNVLQTTAEGAPSDAPRLFVSDFFDFSIYVDAKETDIERWYVERFLKLCDTAFRDEQSYFRRYANLTEEQAIHTAVEIWRAINAPNLVENILPTRNRARLILEKGPNHAVERVMLRKV